MKRLLFIGNFSCEEKNLIKNSFSDKGHEVYTITKQTGNDTSIKHEIVEKYCHDNNIDWVIGASDVGEEMILSRGIKKILINPTFDSTHETVEQLSAFDIDHTFGFFDKRHEQEYEEYHRYGYREASYTINEACNFSNWIGFILSMIDENSMIYNYELIQIKIIGKHYPERRTSEITVGLFPSLREAIKIMHRFKCSDFILGYIIFEYEFNIKDWWHLSERHTMRVYSNDGTQIEDLIYPGQQRFIGHPMDKMRFKNGDIVEVYFSFVGTTKLGIVVELPPTTEWLRNKLDSFGFINFNLDEFSAWDETDDTYLVYLLSEKADSNIPCHHIFSPTQKVPKELRHQLEEEAKKYL